MSTEKIFTPIAFLNYVNEGTLADYAKLQDPSSHLSMQGVQRQLEEIAKSPTRIGMVFFPIVEQNNVQLNSYGIDARVINPPNVNVSFDMSTFDPEHVLPQYLRDAVRHHFSAVMTAPIAVINKEVILARTASVVIDSIDAFYLSLPPRSYYYQRRAILSLSANDTQLVSGGRLRFGMYDAEEQGHVL